MLHERTINALWNKVIIPIYKKTREKTPERTANAIACEMGIDTAMEIFATITKIKEHDGRIYEKNREIMNAIETNPKADYTNIRGLDDIHTAHINQIIGELIKISKEGKYYR